MKNTLGMDASGPVMRVRYNGLFDFDTLYAAIIDWGKNYGYLVHENSYKHKVPSPAGAEQQIKLTFTKNVTDLVAYKIVTDIHTWDQTELDVDIGARKKSLTNARIEIKINYSITVDWQKKFKPEGSKFQQKLTSQLAKWYSQVMGPTIETTHYDQLHYRVLNFQAMIKKYFDMQSKAHPYKGYLGES